MALDMDLSATWEFLFRPGEFSEISPIFSFARQATIKGVGLVEGDEVTFSLVKIKPGRFGTYCDCISAPPEPAEIEALQPLMCGDCEADGQPQPVRLTMNNPVVVLDAPQNSYFIAQFKGDGIGSAAVMVQFNTDSKILDAGMRGCPVACPEANWQESGLSRCNVESNKLECQETDGLGNTRWVECGDLTWTNTGEVQILAGGKVQAQQKDQCGDLRWVAVDESEMVWTATGNQRCDVSDAGDTYQIELEYSNQFGQTKWEAGNTAQWLNTGVTDVSGDGTVRIQQTTVCGDLRWVLVDSKGIVWSQTSKFTCVNLSSESDTYTIRNEYVNPFGQIKWEDGETASWVDTGIFRIAADNAVEKQQTTKCGDLRWKLVDAASGVWSPTGQERAVITEDEDTYQVSRQYSNQYGQIEWRTEESLPWVDTGLQSCIDNRINKQQTTIFGQLRWKATDQNCGYLATIPLPGGGLAFREGQQDPEATVEMQTCDGTTIGFLYPEPRANATIEVSVGCGPDGEQLGYAVGDAGSISAGCECQTNVGPTETKITSLPGLVVAGMPSLNVNIVKMPKLAVGTFEKCGYTWILFNDGSYKIADVVCPADRPITKTVAITYINKFTGIDAGSPPKMVVVEKGQAVEAPAWPHEEPENVMFRGWCLTPDCKQVDFAVGDLIVRPYSIKLYAVWEAVMSYTSEGEASGIPAGQSYNPAVGFKVSDDVPVRSDGYTFVKWKDVENGDVEFASGSMVTWSEAEWSLVKPSVLQAVWQAE